MLQWYEGIGILCKNYISINNFKVVFFKPNMPEGSQYNDLKSSYGVVVTPGIEAAFYTDLVARAITAVESMKSAGSWPSMEYTKCSDYSGDAPITRSVDLKSALQVLFHKPFCIQ